MTKFKQPEFIFILIALWLTLEFFILGPYSYVRVFDVGNLHIPQNIIVAKNFWKWGLSYWYPYTLSGIDLLAEGYRATNLLYMALPYYFFPPWLAYFLFLFGNVFVGGYFTYRLGRNHLKLSEESSFFAGTSVACVLGFWANCLISVLAFVLFYFDKIYEKSKSSIVSILWIIPLSLLFASGSCFVFDHIVLIIIPAWFFFILRKTGFRFWFLYFFFVGIALIYYLPTLWAQFANGSYANRADVVIDLWSQFSQIGGYMFFIHDYRPGHFVFPILWSLGIVWAIWKLRFRNRQFNGTLSIFLLLVGSAFFLNSAAYFSAQYIGFFKGVRFNYTLESLPLFYALVSAFALETFYPLPRRSIRLIFALLFLFTLYPKFWNLNRWSHGDSYVNLFEKNELKMLGDQFNKDNLFRVGSAHWGIFHPVVEAYGLEAVEGYVHLYPKRYQLFLSALLDRDERDLVGNRVQLMSQNLNWNLLSLANMKYVFSDGKNQLFTQDYLEKNDLAVYFKPKNEETLFNSIETTVWDKLENLFHSIPGSFYAKDDLLIFENKKMLPRFFMAKAPKFFDTPDALLKGLRAVDNVDVFRKDVFLEKEYKNEIPFSEGNFRSADIKVMEYTTDRIRLSIDVDGSGVLVASNSYSPFWHVFVDGREARIVPANYAFWGVPIDKQNKEVLFVYDPPYKFTRN